MMFRVTQLGYIAVGVKDVNEWREFATDMVGLQIGDSNAHGLLLRNDSTCYRIRVIEDSRNDAIALGWAVPDAETLDAVEKQIRTAGVTVTRGSAQEATDRLVMGFIAVTDPDGIRSEIYHGLKVNPADPFRAPFPHGGFVTDTEGMGHCGIWVDDIDRSVAFYCNILGMRVTDWAKGRMMTVAFLRCNQRQHSLAIIQAPKPGAVPKRRLHHIQMQPSSLDDVGKAYDKAQKRKIVLATLGKHPAEGSVSFYMMTPAGFAFELAWGGIKIDDSTWQITWHDETPTWGHEFVGLMDAGSH